MRQVHLPVIEIAFIDEIGAINVGRSINLIKVKPSSEKITLPHVPLGLPSELALSQEFFEKKRNPTGNPLS